jgi:2-aminoadipate transaminase
VTTHAQEPFAVERSAAGLAPRGEAIVGSAIDASMSVLAAADRPIVSLAMGSPAADAIPVREIADATERVLAGSRATGSLDYSPTEGHPALRRALLSWLRGHGQAVDPGCLLITAGAMQGLDLVYRLFLEPGDLVLAESPSYANGVATARNHGADVRQVVLDDEGIDLEAARRAVVEAGRPPRILYLVPTYQNPSGRTYSVRRRLEVLAYARETGAIVIEDDPYRELRYGGPSLPSLLELDGQDGRVVQVRTFSKTIAPGLRSGWLVAPRDVVRRMVDLRQTMDTCANALAQAIVADLLESGAFDAHVERLRSLYPRRRDAMDAALAAGFEGVDGVAWTRAEGGMFTWVTLPDGIDGDAVLDAAMRRGVAVVPGSAFDEQRTREAVRLCFSAVDEAAIAVAVPGLCAAVRDVMHASGLR